MVFLGGTWFCRENVPSNSGDISSDCNSGKGQVTTVLSYYRNEKKNNIFFLVLLLFVLSSFLLLSGAFYLPIFFFSLVGNGFHLACLMLITQDSCNLACTWFACKTGKKGTFFFPWNCHRDFPHGWCIDLRKSFSTNCFIR